MLIPFAFPASCIILGPLYTLHVDDTTFVFPFLVFQSFLSPRRRLELHCLSVCWLVTFVIPAKMAEPIEMSFGGLTHTGPRKQVLDGVKVE